MNTVTTALIAAAATAIAATPILAQQRGARMPAECRAEIMALCAPDGQRDRAKMRACLREQAGELSETCRTAVRERMQARAGREGAGRRGNGAVAGIATAPQTLSYGSDPLQALDLWVPAGAKSAPLVLFVHGGGVETRVKRQREKPDAARPSHRAGLCLCRDQLPAGACRHGGTAGGRCCRLAGASTGARRQPRH